MANPRQHYKSLRIMNVVHKIYRIYYVSFAYYFLPVSAMFLYFLQNT